MPEISPNYVKWAMASPTWQPLTAKCIYVCFFPHVPVRHHLPPVRPRLRLLQVRHRGGGVPAVQGKGGAEGQAQVEQGRQQEHLAFHDLGRRRRICSYSQLVEVELIIGSKNMFSKAYIYMSVLVPRIFAGLVQKQLREETQSCQPFFVVGQSLFYIYDISVSIPSNPLPKKALLMKRNFCSKKTFYESTQNRSKKYLQPLSHFTRIKKKQKKSSFTVL